MLLKEFKIKAISSKIRVNDLDKKLIKNPENYEIKDAIGEEGDIVLCKVLNDYGAEDSIHETSGRFVRIYKDDYVICVLGNRFSGINVYGHWNKTNNVTGMHVSLLSAAGIVGILDYVSKYDGSQTINLEIVGTIYCKERKLNLATEYGKWDESVKTNIPIIMVCGTSGEVGKTTTAKDIVRYIKRTSNYKVAGIKIAGTGGLADILEMKDAGADYIADMSEVGLTSSYCNRGDVRKAIYSLLNSLDEKNIDICVCELGGDVTGGNVVDILTDKEIMKNVKLIPTLAFDILGYVGIDRIFKENNISEEMVIVHNINRNIFATDARLNELGFKYETFDVNLEEEKERLAKYALRKGGK